METQTLDRRPPSRAFLFATIVPAAAAVTAFRVVPVVQGLLRAMGQGRAEIPASPWLNALLLAAVSALLAFVLAVPMARAIAAVPRGVSIARALIVLPLFVPATVMTGTLLSIFGVQAGSAGNATPGHWVVAILVALLQTTGVAAVLGSFGNRSRVGTLMAVGAVVLVRFSTAIAPPVDVVATMSVSPTHPVISLPYSVVFGNMLPGSYAPAERAWLLQTVSQAALVAGAFLLARYALRREGDAVDSRPTPTLPGTVLLYGWAAVVAALCVYLVARPLVSINTAVAGIRTVATSLNIGASLGKYAIVTTASTVLAMFFVVTAAYVLYAGRRRRLTCLILLAIASISAPGVHDYLFYRSVGMINTFYPYLVRGFFPVLMVFVLVLRQRVRDASATDYEHDALGEPYRFYGGFIIPNARAILSLTVVQFALAWGYAGAIGIYMTRGPQEMSPATLYQSLVTGSGGADAAAMLLGLIIAAPPVILYLALKRFGEDEVLWGGVRW